MLIPELSVIMPVYNAGNYLSETIESILNQTHTGFEFIILNDNSTDNSLAIIQRYMAKDSRIILINKLQNMGPASLRNEGFGIAKGEFIALMDADDIALPTRFQKQITLLKNNPEIGVCGTWFTFFGAKKNKIIKHSEQHDNIKVSFLNSCGIGNPTVMLRKDALFGLQFDDDYVPVEDYDLWSRLLDKTKFYNIQESLLKYRQHDANISKTKIENVNRSIRKVKISQLSAFGIETTDSKIDSYLHAVSLKKGLNPEEIIEVIKSSKLILAQNKKLGKYNQELLEKHISKTLIRVIRNAKTNNISFYKHLKSNEKELFHKINKLDKTILFFKSVIG